MKENEILIMILLNKISVNILLIKLSLGLDFPKTFSHASAYTAKLIYVKLK